MRRPSHALLALMTACALLLSASLGVAQELEPLSMGYQGHLTDLAGNAYNGERQITFRLYDALTEGNVVWDETLSDVLVSDGYFHVNLGLNPEAPLPLDRAPDAPLFLSVQVFGDDELIPRLRVGAAIRSQWAERATIADPLFVNAPSDLRLSAGSPALDSGLNSEASALDLRGAQRDASPDLGAYEGAP